jgi:hypothetical protein
MPDVPPAPTPKLAPHVVSPLGFMDSRSTAIIADCINNRGVPADALIPPGSPPPGTPGAPTPTAGGILSSILAALLPMLQTCIPAAKTPQGMLDVMQQMPSDTRQGRWLRAVLARHLRAAIVSNSGNLADARKTMAELFEPLHAAIVANCGAMTLPDTTAMLAEQAASPPAMYPFGDPMAF